MITQISTRYIHVSWKPYLENPLQSSAMRVIINKVLNKCDFCPGDPDHIFRAFSVPYDKVKVVILGQDPYPTIQHAIGYAFACPNDQSIPYSMEQILNELSINTVHDLTLGLEDGTPFDFTLKPWRDQGVLLLNRALTCIVGQPGSHSKVWSGFTDYVVNVLASKKDNIVWLLWGGIAQEVIPIISKYPNNHILTHSHPAATRQGKPFIGCKHFTHTNEILKEWNKEPIKWAEIN